MLSSAASSITSTRPAKTTYRWREPVPRLLRRRRWLWHRGAARPPGHPMPQSRRGERGLSRARPLRDGLLVRDLGRHVGRDVLDLLLGQLPLERRHPATAVRDLLDDRRLVLRCRDRGQVGATVAAGAERAVAAGAVVGEDRLAGGGVTGRRVPPSPACSVPVPAPGAAAGPSVPSSENSQRLSPWAVATRSCPRPGRRRTACRPARTRSPCRSRRHRSGSSRACRRWWRRTPGARPSFGPRRRRCRRSRRCRCNTSRARSSARRRCRRWRRSRSACPTTRCSRCRRSPGCPRSSCPRRRPTSEDCTPIVWTAEHT